MKNNSLDATKNIGTPELTPRLTFDSESKLAPKLAQGRVSELTQKSVQEPIRDLTHEPTQGLMQVPVQAPAHKIPLDLTQDLAQEPAQKNDLALAICSLNKSYGDNQVLKDFSCVVPSASTVCFFGPSGQGKTTLLRILMSLEEPDSGVVKWYGKSLENNGDTQSTCNASGVYVAPRISAVFQEDRLCSNLSVLANCLLVLSASTEQRKHVLDALGKVGLSGHEYQPVCELSGGQARRVALVRALLSDYDILILDEPFKGLDEETKDDVINFTKHCTEGKTVLLVTHDILEAKALGAQIISL